MATRLKSMLSFAGLAIGVPSVLPHGLNWNGLAVIPDCCELDGDGYTVTADATNITVTRGATGAAAVHLLAESWHTIERDFGAASTTALSPQPIVIQSGGSSGGGGGGSTITHVTYTAIGGETDTIVVPIPAQPDTAFSGWAIQGEITATLKDVALPPSLFTINHVVLKLTSPPDAGDTFEVFIER